MFFKSPYLLEFLISIIPLDKLHLSESEKMGRCWKAGLCSKLLGGAGVDSPVGVSM